MSGCATPEVSTRELCTHSMHVQCMERFIVEKDIAEGIKKEFDKRHGPTWHCVVGRHFGEYQTLGTVGCRSPRTRHCGCTAQIA